MFQNREEAGLQLAAKLGFYKKRRDAVVYAIPQGGVVVGKQISQNLALPLSIVVVKKLGAPGNPEFAIGAIAPGGVKFIDWDLVLRSGVDQGYLDQEIKSKKEEIDQRLKIFNIQHSTFNIKNKKIVILTDDGVATGATILAAIKYLKDQRPKTKDQKIILAVPVVAKDTYDKLKDEINDIIALEVPDSFSAVGQFYRDFPQITDEEVIKLLK